MDLSYIIIPIIVVFTSQAIKLLTDGIKGNFDIANILSSYGGMPSSHTALATSITTLLAIKIGIETPIFATALVFTLLIIRDATSFRRILGQQNKLFNQLIANLPENKKEVYPTFRERMGHSWPEVFAGAFYGVIITWILTLI